MLNGVQGTWVCFSTCVCWVLKTSYSGGVKWHHRRSRSLQYQQIYTFAALSPKETWHGLSGKGHPNCLFLYLSDICFSERLRRQALLSKWPLTGWQSRHSGTKSAWRLLYSIQNCYSGPTTAIIAINAIVQCNPMPTQGCNKCASRLGMCANPVPDPTSL